jgi:hypothetical protein
MHKKFFHQSMRKRLGDHLKPEENNHMKLKGQMGQNCLDMGLSLNAGIVGKKVTIEVGAVQGSKE